MTVTGEAPLLETSRRRVWAATSIRARCRSCRSTAATGWSWRCWRREAARQLDPNAADAAAGPERRRGARVPAQRRRPAGRRSDIGTGGQPRFSQDSIAEFQFISNRFDATQGRSTGVQVNAITKSGTNQLSGLFRGNFRDSQLQRGRIRCSERVVPIDNQQLSATVGGPIAKDRLHFFANYEYEREPRTSIWNTPYPTFNVELTGTNNQKKGGVRLDYQLSPQTRLMGKVSGGTALRAVRRPATRATRRRPDTQPANTTTSTSDSSRRC